VNPFKGILSELISVVEQQTVNYGSHYASSGLNTNNNSNN
jgi:hypothetical protein